jgi:hypothetical protein
MEPKGSNQTRPQNEINPLKLLLKDNSINESMNPLKLLTRLLATKNTPWESISPIINGYWMIQDTTLAHYYKKYYEIKERCITQGSIPLGTSDTDFDKFILENCQQWEGQLKILNPHIQELISQPIIPDQKFEIPSQEDLWEALQ